jgi:hypothetical protein
MMEMNKLVLVPLDERPCNVNFPRYLARMTDVTLVVPDPAMLGDKKRPADIDRVWRFLEEESQHAQGVVVSIDMLLYGGIVPSRLHHDDAETLTKRLDRLVALKQKHPDLIVHAFHLIMRNPVYSSSDEEPDYYGECGREIHLRGVYEHKRQLGILSSEEKADYERVMAKLPADAWEDYTQRRDVNVRLNQAVIRLVQSGIIDHLIIPQDDASPYGLTALNQITVRETIRSHRVGHKVHLYPGADEVANTLLSRMVHHLRGTTTRVFVRYTSIEAPFLIPLYEDRPLGETIKHQILAAGGIQVHSEHDADWILVVNAPSGNPLNASEAYKKGMEYDVFRSLSEAVAYTKYWIDQGKTVAIGDVAYGNGADLELIELLQAQGLLFRLGGYAGWNTSSNTLGTVIPQAMFVHLFGPSQAHLDFLGLRYAEDAGYCAHVRQDTIKTALPGLGLDYFHADGERGQVASIVKRKLNEFCATHLHDDHHVIHITDCWMPWRRMFEVGLDVKVEQR